MGGQRAQLPGQGSGGHRGVLFQGHELVAAHVGHAYAQAGGAGGKVEVVGGQVVGVQRLVVQKLLGNGGGRNGRGSNGHGRRGSKG